MNAPTSQELFGDRSTGRYDPQKDDFLHGRYTPGKSFSDFRGLKVRGCEACVFGERYQHTCGLETLQAASVLLQRIASGEDVPKAECVEVFTRLMQFGDSLGLKNLAELGVLARRRVFISATEVPC